MSARAAVAGAGLFTVIYAAWLAVRGIVPAVTIALFLAGVGAVVASSARRSPLLAGGAHGRGWCPQCEEPCDNSSTVCVCCAAAEHEEG